MRLKLIQIGNSKGIVIPHKLLKGYNIGDEIDIVITNKAKSDVITYKEVITNATEDVITEDIELIPEEEDWKENMKDYG